MKDWTTDWLLWCRITYLCNILILTNNGLKIAMLITTGKGFQNDSNLGHRSRRRARKPPKLKRPNEMAEKYFIVFLQDIKDWNCKVDIKVFLVRSLKRWKFMACAVAAVTGARYYKNLTRSNNWLTIPFCQFHRCKMSFLVLPVGHSDDTVVSAYDAL